MDYKYIEEFKRLGFGMFVHFGLYSLIGKGEWYHKCYPGPLEEYDENMKIFNPEKDWAKELVRVTKDAGCKYITLTTRHHDGFSLYDTMGLNNRDSIHSGAGRDLVREFTDACREEGIVPFFYHTLLDWSVDSYKDDFRKYIDYLCDSLKILLTNYGKIGGLWFDGMWDKPDADWQEDRIYSMIKSIQPECMIINNTGLDNLGQVGHSLIDSVTFERGSVSRKAREDRPRASEACDSMTDHWGYAREDINYKSVKELLKELITTRYYDGNLLLNVGPLPSGYVNTIEKETLRMIGRFIRKNDDFIYDVKGSSIESSGGLIFEDDKGNYYLAIENVPMSTFSDVARLTDLKPIKIDTKRKILNPIWLDSKEEAMVDMENTVTVKPYSYGYSYYYRIMKFNLGD